MTASDTFIPEKISYESVI
uniref:Uncharacterized protein n=1 Tax=Lepeophtheirus salmonis TaxID=72036 RepID=A0A0K2TLH1_LEPSM